MQYVYAEQGGPGFAHLTKNRAPPCLCSRWRNHDIWHDNFNYHSFPYISMSIRKLIFIQEPPKKCIIAKCLATMTFFWRTPRTLQIFFWKTQKFFCYQETIIMDIYVFFCLRSTTMMITFLCCLQMSVSVCKSAQCQPVCNLSRIPKGQEKRVLSIFLHIISHYNINKNCTILTWNVFVEGTRKWLKYFFNYNEGWETSKQCFHFYHSKMAFFHKKYNSFSMSTRKTSIYLRT